MTPSVGRIVHYVSRGSADGVYPKVCRAAIITQVSAWEQHREELVATIAKGLELPEELTLGMPGSPIVGLAVWNPTGLFFHESVEYDDDKGPGTWHWPERVE